VHVDIVTVVAIVVVCVAHAVRRTIAVFRDRSGDDLLSQFEDLWRQQDRTSTTERGRGEFTAAGAVVAILRGIVSKPSMFEGSEASVHASEKKDVS